MGKIHRPRSGSLQIWPRKRASKVLPRVNWDFLQEKKTDNRLLGFIVYKVGMMSAIVKDSTPDSLTKGKNIVLPVTILEAPSMKIFSVRFYRDNKVIKEVLNENIEKELKKVLKLPKEKKKIELEKEIENAKTQGAIDVRIIVYSNVKKTSIKKTPDIIELGMHGSLDEKINFIKENINKEISIADVLKIGQLIDARGLTKAQGLNGPVRRFGIGLKRHKSEKGRRAPGSLGPWNPSYVDFHTPQAGQVGYFQRISNNLKILDIAKIEQKNINPNSGFEHFGKINSDYIIITGSVSGTQKRALLLTEALRENKRHKKRNYQLIRLA